MEINAVLGAVIGAVVGAAVWAAIAIFTGYEIGWIAWGVGGAVGYGAHIMDGRGTASGIVCALLAAVAILGGKVITINHFINEETASFSDSLLTEEFYNQIKEDAAVFATVGSEAEYPAYMIERLYSDAETPADVTQSEIDYFKEIDVPLLVEWGTSPPAYEAWKEDVLQEGQVFPDGGLLFASLGAMDILFFALGIGTAFQVGSAGGND